MANIIAIFIFLLVIGLSINTVQAGKNYNSSKSNTYSILVKERGLDDAQIQALLEKFKISDSIIHIEEDLLKESLRDIAIPDDQAERILSGLRENAAQELAAKLPKAGLTSSSPFYFLERSAEAIGEFFTFSPQAKARLQVQRALERLAEVQAMLVEKEVDARGIDIALARLEGNLQKASRIIEKEKNKGRDVSTLAKELDVQFGTQKIFLENRAEKAAAKGKIKDLFPPPKDSRIKKVFDSFDQADEKLEEAKKEKKPDLRLPIKVEHEGLPEKPSVPAEEKQLLPAAPLPKEQPATGRIEPETVDQNGAVSAARKNYNSSISQKFTVGKIREEVGNILLRYEIGGLEINRVTNALEQGIDETQLKNLLSEIGVTQAGINETLLKLDEMGAAFPSQ